MKRPGDECPTCKPTPMNPRPERLVKVNGAVVCPHCDSIALWPSVQRGDAEIER